MSQEVTQVVTEIAKTTESSGGLAMLGLNGKIFIAQLINFLIVLIVLWKGAYGPIVKMLDTRSKKIEESLKHAEEIDRRLVELEKDRTEIVSRAKSEAALILEASHKEAEKRSQELIVSAKKEVELVVKKGKEQLNTEKITMMSEVKSEIIEMTLLATKKILEQSVDEKISREIATRVVKEMTDYEKDK